MNKVKKETKVKEIKLIKKTKEPEPKINYAEQEVYVKIPKDRVGALIGKSGQDKKDLEMLSKAKIDIDSGTGDVTITRAESDAFTFYRLEQIVKAIGRGFSPMHAKLLLEASYVLDIMELKEYGLTSDKAMETKRGRIIGTKGAMKKFIESAFDCELSVQGKTIAIIGTMPKVDYAKDAIESLLKGQSIPAVKKQIQKKMIMLKERNFVDNNEDW